MYPLVVLSPVLIDIAMYFPSTAVYLNTLFMNTGVAKGGGAQGGMHPPPPPADRRVKKKGGGKGIGLCHYT